MSFAQDVNQQITALESLFQASLADGFDLSDVVGVLLQGTMAFVQIAQQYQAIPEARKQRAILGALKRVYTSRNVDLPWIPEPFESMLEQILFAVLLPELYQALMAGLGLPQGRNAS